MLFIVIAVILIIGGTLEFNIIKNNKNTTITQNISIQTNNDNTNNTISNKEFYVIKEAQDRGSYAMSTNFESVKLI